MLGASRKVSWITVGCGPFWSCPLSQVALTAMDRGSGLYRVPACGDAYRLQPIAAAHCCSPLLKVHALRELIPALYFTFRVCDFPVRDYLTSRLFDATAVFGPTFFVDTPMRWQLSHANRFIAFATALIERDGYNDAGHVAIHCPWRDHAGFPDRYCGGRRRLDDDGRVGLGYRRGHCLGNRLGSVAAALESR